MAPAAHLPLHRIFPWQPFRLDALGLVTLLGAEEVSRAIGGLQHSMLTEYLPLMGAYMVAGNRFTEPLPGYKAYNITDGIIPPSLNGAFTRWLDNHMYSTSGPKDNITDVTWTLASDAHMHRFWRKQFLPIVIGFFLNSALLIMSVLLADWYGIANSVGMILSVIVRWYLLRQNRHHLGTLVEKARTKITAANPEPKDIRNIRLLVEPPNSNRIVVNRLQGALFTCFLVPLANSHEQNYRFARLVGWLAFAIHIICIGQSSLVGQLMAVGLMIFGTMGAIYRVGCDPKDFGQFLRAESKSTQQQRRECFAKLGPTDEEEKALKHWHLLPERVPNQDEFFEYYDRERLACMAKP
jgi:hypothetical protein